MSIKTPVRPVAVGRSLNFATGALNALCQSLLARHGLSLPQWVILSALWQTDGLPVRALAEYSGNTLAAASRIVDRMIAAGFLTREEDPRDRRAIRVRLTVKAEALRPLQSFHETVNGIAMEGFSQDEFKQLLTLLARVEENARASNTLQCP